jgi:hypothetical protein
MAGDFFSRLGRQATDLIPNLGFGDIKQVPQLPGPTDLRRSDDLWWARDSQQPVPPELFNRPPGEIPGRDVPFPPDMPGL